MKVLIVEDDPFIGDDIAKDVTDHFKTDFPEILGPATTYDEAVDIISNNHPEVALLDISLGDDSDAGLRIAQYLNRAYPIPIIFLSGLPKQLGFDMAKYLMPFEFIHKPVDSERLMEKLELAMIFQRQRKKAEFGGNHQEGKQQTCIFVATAHNEATALTIRNLVLLEVDDKLIRAYTTDRVHPIIFTSPGLKNFYREHLYLLKDFHLMGQKYLININVISQIKDNHVILPRAVKKGDDPHFRLPIPKSNDAKKLLLARLGFKYRGN